MPWEDKDQYIRSGHQSSDKFDPDSMRTMTISEEEGIKAVIGKRPGSDTTEVQSYLFSKEKGWTMEKAKEWFEKHKESTLSMAYRTPSSYYFFTESIHLEGNVVSGVAIHPKLIWHPESGADFKAKHDYLKEELKKAAESLKGKPFGEDHLRLLPAPNVMTEGCWDEQQNGVAFKGTVSDDVAQRIRNKEYKGLSVEIDWKKPGKYVMLEKTNGTAPRNFEFTSVHFLRRFPPGDKEAYVKLMEGIVLPIVPPPLDVQIDMIRELFEERIRYLEGQINAMSHSAGTLGLQSPAIVIFKEAESKFTSEIGQLKDIVKTLVKLKESYVTEKQGLEASVTTKKNEFEGALKLLAERLNTPLPHESETIVAVRKEKFEAENKLKLAESKLTQGLTEADQRYRKLHKEMVESIPYPHIWASWGAGPKMMVQRQLGILGVQPNNYYG